MLKKIMTLGLLVIFNASLAMESASAPQRVWPEIPEGQEGVFIERITYTDPDPHGIALRVIAMRIERDERRPWEASYQIADVLNRSADSAWPLAVLTQPGSEVYKQRDVPMRRCRIEAEDAICETACLRVEDLLNPKNYKYLWLRKYSIDRGGNGYFETCHYPNARENFYFEPNRESQTILNIDILAESGRDIHRGGIRVTSKTTPIIRGRAVKR